MRHLMVEKYDGGRVTLDLKTDRLENNRKSKRTFLRFTLPAVNRCDWSLYSSPLSMVSDFSCGPGFERFSRFTDSKLVRRTKIPLPIPEYLSCISTRSLCSAIDRQTRPSSVHLSLLAVWGFSLFCPEVNVSRCKLKGIVWNLLSIFMVALRIRVTHRTETI